MDVHYYIHHYTHSSYVNVYYTFQLSVQFLIGYVVYINSTFASYWHRRFCHLKFRERHA